MSPARIRRHFRHGMLPQLAVFEAAARLGSFTRAAQALHLAQPTVSTQIRKLSETLGVTLFEQVGRHVHLTDAGRLLYEGCRELFACFERLDASLAELRGLESGLLRLAVASSAVPLVTPLLADFSARHPAIEVRVQVGNREQLRDRLARNDDDLYLMVEVEGDARVVARPLCDEHLVVVARPDHPLAARTAIPLQALHGEAFVLREPGSGARSAVDAAFERAGVNPSTRLTMSGDAAIREAVIAGLGLAVLSRAAAGLTAPAGGPGAVPATLVALDVTPIEIVRRWQIAHPAGKQLSPAAQAFAAMLDERRTAPGGWPREAASDAAYEEAALYSTGKTRKRPGSATAASASSSATGAPCSPTPNSTPTRRQCARAATPSWSG